MVFTRTISGLRNYPLFFNGTNVVFIEGGDTSFSFEDAIKDDFNNNSFNNSSIDILYWKPMFEKFLSSQGDFKYRPLGGKETVKEVAKMVANVSTNVFVAMDRDYDEISKEIIDGNNIFYTYGYSMENEIWNGKVAKEVLKVYCHGNYSIGFAGKEIDRLAKKFLKEISWYVCADLIALIKNDTHLLPKKGGFQKYIKCKPSPSLIKAELTKIFVNYFKLPKREIEKSFTSISGTEDLARLCPGHFLEYFFLTIINYLNCKITNKKNHMHSYSIKCLAISKFFETFDSDDFKELYDFYESQFARI
jgi:hypothetical protein